MIPASSSSAMPHPRTVLGFLLIMPLPLAFAGNLVPVGDAPTAYAMLERYDFPRGILPEGVTSYLLRPDGSFDVYLTEDCNFKVSGGYLLNYRTKISGKVEVGRLTELRGVRVKVLFVWFGVSQVLKNGGELDFYVGPLSASFPLSNFNESPRCQSGSDSSSAAGLSDS